MDAIARFRRTEVDSGRREGERGKTNQRSLLFAFVWSLTFPQLMAVAALSLGLGMEIDRLEGFTI